MAWEDGLSDEQRRAASVAEMYVRLLAGPGTGKTRTLTNRVAYLQEVLAVPSNEILVLTFGRAAARELRERLEQLGIETRGTSSSRMEPFETRFPTRTFAGVRASPQ